MCCRKGFSPDG
ncbi:hypothetical protein F383_07133 [Gossypium arboreum]|uniref:Uncharacterized protein n=1 Tax=Gossypium arboreum TaxID=29729 RepID=A0A0B0N8U3_GOSAR|nr:hypothetical protein F383_37455 [Gossypium arboreum]KHF99800.1 hypothetical protein F383_19450 [Gossypium arboreum]KHF99939.1 hypothetical protein F383_38737 [Gossypium arboreum]KHG01177.1 hypothetical protein F383_21990 [Gossypium arboreum]KHG06407.1 hypothetical protein F383_32817 [Gossypium arboreum]